jgi:hypothetical protein
MTIIINALGEPGSGKSTFSFGLIQALKRQGVRAEFVPEVVKYESYSEARVARLVSARFDQRFLARQFSFIEPLLGHTDVIVNDGPLVTFFYYAQMRMRPEQLERFRHRLDRYMAVQARAEVRYVAPVRSHAYEPNGRFHTESESQAIRQDLFQTLGQTFGIQPVVLHNQAQQIQYARDLAQEVNAPVTIRPVAASPSRRWAP